LDIQGSKYGGLIIVQFWLNCNKMFKTDTGHDTITDLDFSKPLTILIKKYYVSPPISGNGWVTI
jgi:hypothetical protein